jgi:hypothetical protein
MILTGEAIPLRLATAHANSQGQALDAEVGLEAVEAATSDQPNSQKGNDQGFIALTVFGVYPVVWLNGL